MRRENEHSLHLQHSRGANPGEATGSEHAGETHDPVTTRTCADRSSSPQKSSTLVTATLITATLVTAALEMPETHMNSRVVATPPNPSVTFRFPTPLTGRTGLSQGVAWDPVESQQASDMGPFRGGHFCAKAHHTVITPAPQPPSL